MMENFNLSIIDNILGSMIIGDDFNEFSENLELLHTLLYEDIYIEAVSAKNSGVKSNIKTIIKNTRDTTKGVATVYGYAVDGKASFMKSTFDLFLQLLKIITKIIRFIYKKIE